MDSEDDTSFRYRFARLTCRVSNGRIRFSCTARGARLRPLDHPGTFPDTYVHENTSYDTFLDVWTYPRHARKPSIPVKKLSRRLDLSLNFEFQSDSFHWGNREIKCNFCNCFDFGVSQSFIFYFILFFYFFLFLKIPTRS